MKRKRKQRIFSLFFVVVGVGIAAGLALYGLRQDVNWYLTPSQAFARQIEPTQEVRVGGFVRPHSLKHQKHLHVSFVITDFHHDLIVQYDGILPTLFREGQGVVVKGKLTSKGVFRADQVLAKHGANYRPPEINAS